MAKRRGIVLLVALLAVVAGILVWRQQAGSGGASGCGAEPPAPGSGRWVCTFADDFDGNRLDTSKWSVTTSQQTGFRNGLECYVADPRTVSVSGGDLHLSTIRVPVPRACPWGVAAGRPALTPYLSGMVSTRGHFAQTYGRFEIRAAFPALDQKGVGSAVWMWPQAQTHGRDGNSGEIDLVEYYSGFLPQVGFATVKYHPRISAKPPQSGCALPRPDTFHTYTVVWSPRLITILYDGHVCLASQWDPRPPLQAPAPFDHAFNVVMTQSLVVGADPVTVPFPEGMKVDYVRAWRYES